VIIIKLLFRIIGPILAFAVLAGTINGSAVIATDIKPMEISRLASVGETKPEPLNNASAADAFLGPVASGTSVKNNGKVLFDVSNTDDGYVMVRYLEKNTSTKLKVIITGPSRVKYTYNLRNDGEYDVFPLSDGNGEYTIGAYKNITGTRYSTLMTCKLNVELTDEFAPFIRPNQYVNFTEDSTVAKLALELTEKKSETLEKVGAIYAYVVENFVYDYELARTVKSGYIPDVDKVLEREKGICFDYAAVMTAMLRSRRIPCKLVVGYAGNNYHAWINVYSEDSGWMDGVIFFDGENWRLMDPTFASGGASEDYIDSKIVYNEKYLY
jgi:transglutaminase-like putative cysteine protease